MSRRVAGLTPLRGVTAGRRYGTPRGQAASLSEAAFVTAARKEDEGFRFLSGAGLNRDLPGHQHDRMIALSFALWRQNGMAHRLINMEVDFLLGTGIKVASDDTDTLEFLDDWWKDPHNNWPLRSVQRFRDLLIYGEWVHVPVTHEASGRSWINVLQPDKIRNVVPREDSHEILDHLYFKRVLVDGQPVEDKKITIIQPEFDFGTGEVTAYPGDVHLFGINRTTDTTRGVGQLFPLIDYLDLYDEMVYNRAERVRNSGSLWWDLKLEGMSKEQIEEFVTEATDVPPRPGTMWAHNEHAELMAKTPDMKADDHTADAELLRSVIVSAAGFPGIFFDSPGSAGRAVAQEMAEPTFRTVLALQDQAREFLTVEMNYALHQYKTANKGFTPGEFHLSFPRPSTRDLQRTGPAVYRLSQAIDLMLKDDVMAREDAIAMWASQMNQLGLSDRPFKMEIDLEVGGNGMTPQKPPQLGTQNNGAPRDQGDAEPVPQSQNGRSAEPANSRSS